MNVINKLIKLSSAILSTIAEQQKTEPYAETMLKSNKVPEPEVFSCVYDNAMAESSIIENSQLGNDLGRGNDLVRSNVLSGRAAKSLHNGNSLESKYYLQSQLRNLFIVARENLASNGEIYYTYLVFADVHHFVAYANETPAIQRNFHEVIFGWMPQRIKFDIDAYFSNLDELPEFFDKFADFLDVIVSIFYLFYYEQLDENSIIITTSSGEAEKNGKIVHKCSYHIIINKYVADSDEAKNFTENVISAADPEFVKYVDCSVNKKLQLFRLFGCTKLNVAEMNKPRFKTLITLNDVFIDNTLACDVAPVIDAVTLEKTLISGVVATNNTPKIMPKKLASNGSGSIAKGPEISNEDVLVALKMAEPYMQDQIYRQTVYSGGIINLTRIRPGYCKICDVIHQHESSMIILSGVESANCGESSNEKTNETTNENTNDLANKTPDTKQKPPAINVYFKCRRDLSKSVLLGVIGENHKEIDRLDRFLRNPIDFKDRAVFATLSPAQRNVYESPQMADFESPAVTGTLCVVAGMKMGKTKSLKQYIAANFAPTSRIVVVSFRQTFAADMHKKFPEMTLYSKVKGMLTQPRVIVQVESLHRLTIEARDNCVDLLVLDESESILEQFDAKLAKNFNMVWENFRWLVKYAKNVVCMDAGMSSRTYTALNVIRNKPIFYHCNTFANATQDKYFITLDKQLWYYNLFAFLAAGKKIVIPINTLAEAKVIRELISRKFPALKIGFYSSETSMSLKREHFSNVDEYWSVCDVLIYTPTVSAGVSYECKHFDKIFPYMTDESCSVETCIQMIGRIRDVADKELYVYINASGGRLPVTTTEIKRALYQSRDNLNSVFDTTHLALKRTKTGEIKYHQSPYFYVWMENTKARNLSKNAFIQRFIYCVRQPGAKVEKMVGVENKLVSVDPTSVLSTGTKYSEEVQEIIAEETKSVRRTIKNNEAKLVASASELTDVEVTKITEKIVDQAEISPDEMIAYEKFKLRRAYNYGGEIDTDFILKYRDKRLISRFKNIKRVLQYENVEIALNKIQEEELLKYKEIMERDESLQAVDLKRTYTFDKHRIALGLLVLCGWSSIVDPKTVIENDLYKVLAENAMKIYNLLLANQSVFGIKRVQIYCFKTANATAKNTAVKNANPDRSAVLGVLKYVNGILHQMYGVEIKQYKLDKTMYVLSKITDFDITRQDLTKVNSQQNSQQNIQQIPNLFGTWCPVGENQVVEITNVVIPAEEQVRPENEQPETTELEINAGVSKLQKNQKISIEEYLQKLFE